MKLGVIGGAGLLGATTAFCVAANNLVDEIVLYDVKVTLALSHAMDIDQAVCEFSKTRVTAGAFDDLKDCDILINTVSVPERGVQTRDKHLRENIKILRGLAEKIKEWKSEPIIVSASNPIDVLNYKLFEITGFPPEKFIGFSSNDTLRLKWAAAEETGIPARRIDALVVGEHGVSQVPVFSLLRRKDAETPIALSGGQRQSIVQRINTWFRNFQALDCGRSSGWTSGIGLLRIIRQITENSDEIIPCSVIPNGEYGLRNLSIGLPARLGKTGVREIIEVGMEDEEMAELNRAADKILNMIKLC